MESNKESDMKKVKRTKSATRYPKRMPTYVVAFSVQESRDDLSKHLQILAKRSIENSTSSTKSLSPVDSTSTAKTFTITPTENSYARDVATISEVKIDILDENQCGDIDKKSPQMRSYTVLDNRTVDEQPEIIFNASKHIKRCKDSNKFPRKKPRKNKRVIKFKNIHFKYKNPKNSITRRLERYYENEKNNSPNAEHMYSNILSKVVSRSRVLKKVFAKVDLLADRVPFYDGASINEYEDGSLNSSPSTTKKSFISYTSQNTLVRKCSSSSRNDDFYSIKPANSVVQVSSEIIPYKTDIIDLSVAVAYSAPNNKQTALASDATFTKDILTSDETILQNDFELTSLPSSEDPINFKINYDDLSPLKPTEINTSEGTIVGEQKSVIVIGSDDDAFVIARTSSDFNKSSYISDLTLSSYSDTTIHIDNLQPNVLTKDGTPQNTSKRATLLDTVINLGFYPTLTPSTSSDTNEVNEMNEVLITDSLLVKSFPLSPQNKGDDNSADIRNNLSVFKKSVEVEKVACIPKNISLPNDIAIKAIIKESEKIQRRSGPEEVRNKYPADLGEMWERLTLVLDMTVKRLEETLAERIVKDIKASLVTINQQEQKVNKVKLEKQPVQLTATQQTPSMYFLRPIPEMLHKEVFVIENYLKQNAEICVQCDLVQNQVIDQLMLSLEGPKMPTKPSSTESLKKLNKPEVKDFLEILKPHATESVLTEVGRAGTVTVSTATAEFQAVEHLNRFRVLWSGPVAFIRENLFVITSVPTFFIVLLCLYGIIIIIMKPW